MLSEEVLCRVQPLCAETSSSSNLVSYTQSNAKLRLPLVSACTGWTWQKHFLWQHNTAYNCYKCPTMIMVHILNERISCQCLFTFLDLLFGMRLSATALHTFCISIWLKFSFVHIQNQHENLHLSLHPPPPPQWHTHKNTYTNNLQIHMIRNTATGFSSYPNKNKMAFSITLH